MEIGLFQIENLVLTQTRFCLIDLRTLEPAADNPQLSRILAAAIKLNAKNVQDYLLQHKMAKDEPIILMCENGLASQALAVKLESSGYKNIYVVERGIEGLLSEL